MTATEVDEIRKRWERLRVCNVCRQSFQSSREMKDHKATDHGTTKDPLGVELTYILLDYLIEFFKY